MSEMREARLGQRLMDRQHAAAGLGLQLERVQVDLGSGHKLEAHRADEDEIRPRPFCPCVDP